MEQIDWPRYFREELGGDIAGYARKRWAYNAPIFDLMYRRFPGGAKVLECGSGAGTWSIMLSRFGYEVVGVELDPEMVALATKNAEMLGGGNIRFEEGSILEMDTYYGRFDVAYSSGVIEHFYHDDAVRVLREEARCAPWVLVYVPSKYPWEKGRLKTDGIFERYTVKRLRKVVEDAGLEIVEEVGFSAGNRVGRAVELLAPPLLQRRVFKHFASTIGILARSRDFSPRT